MHGGASTGIKSLAIRATMAERWPHVRAYRERQRAAAREEQAKLDARRAADRADAVVAEQQAEGGSALHNAHSSTLDADTAKPVAPAQQDQSSHEPPGPRTAAQAASAGPHAAHGHGIPSPSQHGADRP